MWDGNFIILHAWRCSAWRMIISATQLLSMSTGSCAWRLMVIRTMQFRRDDLECIFFSIISSRKKTYTIFYVYAVGTCKPRNEKKKQPETQRFFPFRLFSLRFVAIDFVSLRFVSWFTVTCMHEHLLVTLYCIMCKIVYLMWQMAQRNNLNRTDVTVFSVQKCVCVVSFIN
jgi:hypothetical protein